MLLGEQAKREAALAEASPRTQRGAGGGQGAKSLAFIFMCIYLEKEEENSMADEACFLTTS